MRLTAALQLGFRGGCVVYLCVWVDLLQTLRVLVLQTHYEGLQTAHDLDGACLVINLVHLKIVRAKVSDSGRFGLRHTRFTTSPSSSLSLFFRKSLFSWEASVTSVESSFEITPVGKW